MFARANCPTKAEMPISPPMRARLTGSVFAPDHADLGTKEPREADSWRGRKKKGKPGGDFRDDAREYAQTENVDGGAYFHATAEMPILFIRRSMFPKAHCPAKPQMPIGKSLRTSTQGRRDRFTLLAG